jgi:hypothetical protein
MAVETLDVGDMLPTKFEPLTKRRFLLEMEGIDSYIVKTGARPKMTTTEIKIPWINSTRYIAGKSDWSTMAVTLFDPIAPSGAQQVMEWVRLTYESVSGRGGYADFYKRDIRLKLLDPVGTVVQLWDIKGAWISDVDFGGVDYSSDTDLAEITLTLRYDNAVLSF